MIQTLDPGAVPVGEAAAELRRLRLAVAIASIAQREQADPIVLHRFSSAQTRDMFLAVLFDEIEYYLRSGNMASKSTEGAFLGVCIARGIRRIDGRTINESTPGHAEYLADPQWIDLPVIAVPNVGVLCVQGYEQASESIIPAYMKWIGEWDHKYHMDSHGSVVGIRIRPDRVRHTDPKRWSRIIVLPKKGQLPKGMRLKWAQADEPPAEPMWREIRGRRKRGEPMFRWLTLTPLDRNEWEWLRKDFAHDTDWQREVSMSVRDNQALSDYDLKMLLASFEHDPFKDARIDGEYVDLSGASPFLMQRLILDMWAARCRNPLREEEVRLRAELPIPGLKGIHEQEAMGRVYIWEDAIAHAQYWVIGDSALGVPDGKHDKLGAHVYRLYPGRPALVARYNGYLGGMGLGWLMATLGERYNDALVDFDATGGYGASVTSGLSRYRSEKYEHGYQHIARDMSETKLFAEFDPRYGFTSNHASNAHMLSQLRVLMDSDVVDFWSAAVVKCFREAVVDDYGRLFKPPGVRYEDLTCSGRFAVRWLQMSPAEQPAAVIDPVRAAFRESFGRDVLQRGRHAPTRAYPRMRWRRT